MYTLRANEDSSEWTGLGGRADLPAAVARLWRSGAPSIVDAEAASEIQAWIESVGWIGGEAPVLLDPVGN